MISYRNRAHSVEIEYVVSDFSSDFNLTRDLYIEVK